MMNDAPRIAHSPAEIRLFFLASSCTTCGQGPLRVDDGADPIPDRGGTLSVQSRCPACAAVRTEAFRIDWEPIQPSADLPRVINPTSEPSHILDVAQWMTLSAMILERTAREPGRVSARCLAIEAAMCLEEALKFYEDESDLPGPSAFFHARSRERFASHPEQFSRHRLLHLRSRLPHTSA